MSPIPRRGCRGNSEGRGNDRAGRGWWWGLWGFLATYVSKRRILCTGGLFLWEKERITDAELKKCIDRYEKCWGNKTASSINIPGTSNTIIKDKGPTTNNSKPTNTNTATNHTTNGSQTIVDGNSDKELKRDLGGDGCVIDDVFFALVGVAQCLEKPKTQNGDPTETGQSNTDKSVTQVVVEDSKSELVEDATPTPQIVPEEINGVTNQGKDMSKPSNRRGRKRVKPSHRTVTSKPSPKKTNPSTINVKPPPTHNHTAHLNRSRGIKNPRDVRVSNSYSSSVSRRSKNSPDNVNTQSSSSTRNHSSVHNPHITSNNNDRKTNLPRSKHSLPKSKGHASNVQKSPRGQPKRKAFKRQQHKVGEMAGHRATGTTSNSLQSNAETKQEDALDGSCKDKDTMEPAESQETVDQEGAGVTAVEGNPLEDWTMVAEQSSCTVYSKPYCDTGLLQYKVIGSYSDITAKDFFDVQVDNEERKSWDAYALKLETIDRDTQTNSEVVHWILKFPFPMASREYVFVRRGYVDTSNNKIVLVNRAVEHPAVPEKRQYVRVKTYFSETVIKPHTSMDKLGFSYELTYFDDPGSYLPSSALNWVTKSAMPDFLSKIHTAALHRNRHAHSPNKEMA